MRRQHTLARLSRMRTGPMVPRGAVPGIGEKIPTGSTDEPNGMACATIRSVSDTCTAIARNCGNTKARSELEFRPRRREWLAREANADLPATLR